jgi:hypothetical protein
MFHVKRARDTSVCVQTIVVSEVIGSWVRSSFHVKRGYGQR